MNTLLIQSNDVRGELASLLTAERLRVAQCVAEIASQAEGLRDLAARSNAAEQEHARQAAALTSLCDDLRGRLGDAESRLVQQDRAIAAQALSYKEIEAVYNRDAALLGRVHHSYVFRLMRKLGLWEWLDPAPPAAARVPAAQQPAKALRKVAIDLTPMLPGGDNGGAKIMTLELIHHLGKAAPDCEFILLTSKTNHDDLAALDSRNVRRICTGGSTTPGTSGKATGLVLRLLARIFPAGRLATLRGITASGPEETLPETASWTSWEPACCFARSRRRFSIAPGCL